MPYGNPLDRPKRGIGAVAHSKLEENGNTKQSWSNISLSIIWTNGPRASKGCQWLTVPYNNELIQHAMCDEPQCCRIFIGAHGYSDRIDGI